MYTAINGIYEDGQFTLTESPPKVKKSKVVILFLEDQETGSPTKPQKGVKLGSLEGQYQIPENFNEPLDDLNEYM
ncbi:hypothetical protein GCM10028808_37170 [Spirosoma migulaei]